MNDNSRNTSGAVTSQDYRLQEEIVFDGNIVRSVTDSSQIEPLSYVSAQQTTAELKNDQCTEQIVSVFDAAKYVLELMNEQCTTMKLHKLLYYCQAWNLVWEDKKLFNEKIEAWANGPVVRELFNYHKGMYWISKNNLTLGNSSKLSQLQKDNVKSVISFYGGRTSQWLIDQTHSERPWRDARKGLAPNERGDSEITPQSMFDYFSSLK
jgi:uncharacterized phage-associated protein